MKQNRSSVASTLAIFVFLGWAETVVAAGIDQLVALAKKEGAVEFLAPSSWPPNGVEMIAEAFNKKYGLNLRVGRHFSQQMAQDVSKVMTRAATGVGQEWDVIVVTDAHHAILSLKKLHQSYDYKALGVNPKMVHYGNGTVSIANQLVQPAYNKKVLPARDVPANWEDLLDPKWKGGKIGVSVATHHFARLSVGAWGVEKGNKYVEALAKLEPNLGTLGQLYTRLQIGEVLVSSMLLNGLVYDAEKRGAPIVFAEKVEPVIAPAYHAGVPKGAAHPNAGHLLAVFLTTPEGQDLMEKYTGYTSALVPGTRAYKYVQGKKVLYMADDQAEIIDKLANDYTRILGFQTK
ncbi:MAG: ABC transporter substrate-binding protein [Deltaproteobacteria bacterium]|nr:ABC transporter substrate-binding protein [Deltaproteobacteria bacterium]